MDANLKTRWTEALRSGGYKQAEGKLHDADQGAYCCLGVLCVVAGLPIDDDGYSPDGYIAIREIVGGEDQTGVLWRMNDTGDSFARIADYIEANL